MIEKVEKVTYWAWYNDEKKVYSHIYSRRFQVEMCSPDGYKQATERGEGKIVEVEICQLFEPKPDEGRLLTDEVLADLMNEECPDNIARLVIRVRNLQDGKTASIKDAEFAKEKELMFNPDWAPDIQAMLKEFNESVETIKLECQEKVEQTVKDDADRCAGYLKLAREECQQRVERILFETEIEYDGDGIPIAYLSRESQKALQKRELG